MNPGPSVERILSELDTLSRTGLRRRADLGFLLEAASRKGRESLLEQAGFHAKFASRAERIMKRIGPGGEGYDKLSAECAAALERVRSLVERVLEGEDTPRARALAAGLRAHTLSALASFMDLCCDLGWYKNRLLDAGRGSRRPAPDS
ncbi:MAG: hypothetical protein WB626_06385 [Bacteroidota bacterium]